MRSRGLRASSWLQHKVFRTTRTPKIMHLHWHCPAPHCKFAIQYTSVGRPFRTAGIGEPFRRPGYRFTILLAMFQRHLGALQAARSTKLTALWGVFPKWAKRRAECHLRNVASQASYYPSLIIRRYIRLRASRVREDVCAHSHSPHAQLHQHARIRARLHTVPTCRPPRYLHST